MSRPPRSLILLLGVCLTCQVDERPAGVDAAADNFDRHALIENLARNIVLPTYEAFDTSATALRSAIGEHCAALEGAAQAQTLESARAAWATAMDIWQHAEMMLLGPVTVGNKRDNVYSWPVVSACAVDLDVMIRHNDPGVYDIGSRLPNRRGLAAIEYLLYVATLDSACAPQVRPAGWDALDDASKREARCRFAELAAADLERQARDLRDAWHPAKDDYVGDLSDAGNSAATAREALNAVFGAMFAIDGVTKDQKLGEPAGLMPNTCGAVAAACPDELESPFASASKQNIAANLRAFRLLFLGETLAGEAGVGFDDFLLARGHGELSQTLDTAITGAIAAVEAIPGTMTAALDDSYQDVAAAHTAVKAITDPLKTDFPNILDLEIPLEAKGDAD